MLRLPEAVVAAVPGLDSSVPLRETEPSPGRAPLPILWCSTPLMAKEPVLATGGETVTCFDCMAPVTVTFPLAATAFLKMDNVPVEGSAGWTTLVDRSVPEIVSVALPGTAVV